MNTDWDRIRIFLAVAQHGQLAAAAKHLNTSNTTVGRQLSALEEALKTPLLIRNANQCTLTEAGEALLAVAVRANSEFSKYAPHKAPGTGSIHGAVRIGAPDGFGNYFLSPILSSLSARHPNLLVQLVPLPHSFSISRREADLVIAVERPAQGNLILQRLTDYSLSLYGSQKYLDEHPDITGTGDLPKHLLITYVDDLLYSHAIDYGSMLAITMPRRFECGTLVGQMEAIRSGCGIGILHDYIAHRDPGLIRILPTLQFTRDYWLVSHSDARHSPAVMEVRKRISEAVNANRALFNPWNR